MGIKDFTYADNELPLCDFDKLQSAISFGDKDMAADWYLNDYMKSCFVAQPGDQIRRLRNGFIMLIGYMRAAVVHKKNSTGVYMMECSYIRVIERCNDSENIFQLFLTAFDDFVSLLSENGAEDLNGEGELKECTAYIFSNLNMPLTLGQIAEHCNYNQFYLSRKFKQTYGVSISKYIMRERLKAASGLLKHSSMSIADIANRFQFSSQSHFQAVFKKSFNMTPVQYRKNYRKHTTANF